MALQQRQQGRRGEMAGLGAGDSIRDSVTFQEKKITAQREREREREEVFWSGSKKKREQEFFLLLLPLSHNCRFRRKPALAFLPPRTPPHFRAKGYVHSLRETESPESSPAH